jgi:hypothetical protein
VAIRSSESASSPLQSGHSPRHCRRLCAVVVGWQRTLKGVFDTAGIPDSHAHRFRDTFAVGLLQAGVPIERVSVLLGHSSMKMTEKYYSPWVQEAGAIGGRCPEELGTTRANGQAGRIRNYAITAVPENSHC